MIKLENLTDLELVNKCRCEYCSDCLKLLRKRHEGLLVQTINRYLKRLNEKGYSSSEILGDIDRVIWNSIEKFKPEKSAFPTFLANCMRFHCLNILNSFKERSEKILDTTPEMMHNLHDTTYCEESNNKELRNYTFNILNQLPDKRIKRIFKLRYFSGKKKMSFKKIGKRVGITGWWASLLFQSGCKLLREKMLDKNISDKI